MEHGRWYTIAGVVLVVVCLVGSGIFLRAARINPPEPVTDTVADSTPEINLTGLSIYTDGKHGFSIFYPARDAIKNQFSSSGVLSSSWRVNPIATGTPIVSISEPMDAGSLAQVRIAESTSVRELRQCLRVGPGESALPDVTLGGTRFKAFAFDRTGTDTELQVQSYRAIHDQACYAIETIITPGAATSSILSTVSSFSFARP